MYSFAYACRNKIPRLLSRNVIDFIFRSQQHCRKKHGNRNILKLHERGMYENIFPETASNDIIDLLNINPQCVYAGFDPTASSLHIGNLLILINLLHWQRGGHKVIIVIGEATARIGDPSGKDKDRIEQDRERIAEQTKNITKNIYKIFSNHERYILKEDKTDPITPFTVLNNMSWYKDMNVVDFIDTIGRHFRMGKMLLKESVSKRLESTGMNFTEFSYQLFQAYDWLHLCRKYDCRFQVGGTDQMGNIVGGQNLISRILNKHVYGLTLPLITTDAGDKFGKSLSNAVWLDRELTTAFEFYQFFQRTEDADVGRLLKLFTFLPVGVIDELMRVHHENPEKRIPQNKLAEQMTLLVHGEKGLKAAKNSTAALYSNDINALSKVPVKDLPKVFEGATIVDLLLRPGITILQMALEAKCFLFECDARRIIDAGGFYINYSRVTNIDEVLTQSAHILPNNTTLVRVGKRNYWIVRWTG